MLLKKKKRFCQKGKKTTKRKQTNKKSPELNLPGTSEKKISGGTPHPHRATSELICKQFTVLYTEDISKKYFLESWKE